MSNRSATFESPIEESSPVQWAFHVWSWIILLFLFVALEFWVDPLLASLVLCLKLGWKDITVALRLRRQLPPGAAKTLGRFCIALACVKVACAGVLLTAAVVACESLFGVQPQIGRFLAGFAMLVLGLGFAELALMFGAGTSLAYRIRPWLDTTIYENLLKPDLPLRCRGTRNRLRWLLVFGMFLISITFLPSPLLAIVLLVKLGNPLLIPGGIVFATFWYLTFRAMHSGFVNLAKTPDECWPTVT